MKSTSPSFDTGNPVPPRDVRIGDLARTSLSQGIEFVAKIVGATFGPLGGYALVDKAGGAPQVTRAAVEIIGDFASSRHAQNAGVQMLLALAKTTGTEIPPASSTTMLLAAAIVREGLLYVANGHHPVAIRNALERAAKAVSAELERVSRTVEIATFQEAFAEIWSSGDRTVHHFAQNAGVRDLPSGFGQLVVQPDECVPAELISAGASSGVTDAQVQSIFEAIGIAQREAREQARRRSSEPTVNWPLLESVASSAAGGHDSLAHCVIDAFKRVGVHGYVAAELGYGAEPEILVSEGLQFSGGLLSAHLSTEPGRTVAVHKDALVLITDQSIGEIRDLLPLLEAVAKAARPLLIIANDVTGSALATLVINRVRGILRVVAVKPGGDAGQRAAVFEDAGAATGARLIADATGLSLRNATINDLGRARLVEASENDVVIVSDYDGVHGVHAHIEALNHRLRGASSTAEQSALRERIARVSRRLARIAVGGRSVIETQKNLGRCEGIIRTVRRAIEKGVVPGGGAALLHAARAARYLDGGTDAQRAGVAALVSALQVPTRKILGGSAGRADAGAIIKAVAGGDARAGYDAISGKVGSRDAYRITDPVSALQQAVLAAASLAGLVLMTEVLITAPQKNG
jgi:chaperonin GroEL